MITLNQPTFFDFATGVGIPKHRGSLEAANALIEFCRIGEGKHVLDVGCGVGVTSGSIARRYGCRVAGVDILEMMIERSKERMKREGIMDRFEFFAYQRWPEGWAFESIGSAKPD
jgi:cyclopropane fatty-acyl-phospholipid synthase-like methyltransferase